MTTFALVQNGRVLSHFSTNRPISDFPDLQGSIFVAPDNVQDGWEYNGSVFAQHVLTAEEQRLKDFDAAIDGDATLAQIKAMSNAQLDTWWAANITNATQAIAFLKRLTKVMIRRVL